MIQAISWMPWVLWAARRTAASPIVARAVALAVVTALCILAGHPQMAYVGAVLAVATAGAHAIRRTSDCRYRARVFVAAAGAMAFGAALSAAFWMPAVQTLIDSSRSGLSLAKSSRFVLQPQHFLAMLWPGYFGDPATGNYWATGNMWEPALYVGVPQLALAIFALGMWRRDTRVPYHGLVAGVSLWLAFGAWGGLYAATYYVVPGMEGFHDPARFGIPATLGLSCLSAVGLDALRRHIPRRRLMIGVALSVALLLAWTSRLTPTIAARELQYRARLASVGGGHRVYTAMRQELWSRYVRYDDYGADSGRYVHELTDTVSPNLGMRYGIEEAGGYEPVPLRSPAEYEGAARQAVTMRSPVARQLLAGMDARFVLIPLGLRYSHPALEPVETRGNLVFRQRDWSSRAWVVFQARHVPVSTRAVAALSDPRFDIHREAITGSAVPLPQSAPAGDGPEAAVAQTRAESAQRIRISVGPIPRRGLLVVAMSAAPGWRARVDGTNAAVVSSNAAFMGVVVPPGRHSVVLEYQPGALAVGLYVSLCSLAYLIGWLAARRSLRQGTLSATE